MSSMDNFPSPQQIPHPKTDEASAYFFTYVKQVEGDDAMQAFQQQYFSSLNFYKDIPQEKWDYRYAEGKWTIKEILQHVIDSERVFAYRALRIARGDDKPLAGFDQDPYVTTSGASERSALSLIDEYKTVRLATYSLFENIPSEHLGNLGIADGASVSCRALAWIIIGHEIHHIKVIRDLYL